MGGRSSMGGTPAMGGTLRRFGRGVGISNTTPFQRVPQSSESHDISFLRPAASTGSICVFRCHAPGFAGHADSGAQALLACHPTLFPLFVWVLVAAQGKLIRIDPREGHASPFADPGVTIFLRDL